jgi:hypothetical protein
VRSGEGAEHDAVVHIPQRAGSRTTERAGDAGVPAGNHRVALTLDVRLDAAAPPGDGDSGGPVYFGNADGTVRGTGTNSAVDTILPCPPGTRSSICGGRLYYADLPQALAFYGATITTS